MRSRLLRLAAHASFLLLGLVMLTWPWTFGAHPRVDCRGVEMHAGDVCHKAELDGSDRGRTQTYEERLAAKQGANPTIAGVGALVTAFAGYLLWSAGRGRGSEAELTASDGSVGAEREPADRRPQPPRTG